MFDKDYSLEKYVVVFEVAHHIENDSLCATKVILLYVVLMSSVSLYLIGALECSFVGLLDVGLLQHCCMRQ